MLDAQIQIEDIGTLDGPVLIYGGPYSNLQATRALMAEARRLGIPPARRICTGDIIAYCADPLATLRMVRAEGGFVTAGNTERQLGAGADDCGCGFSEGSACDLLARGWYPYALRAVLAGSCEGDRAYLRGLPDLTVFRTGGRKYAVVHGGITDIARYIWPTSPDEVFNREIAAIRTAAGDIDGVIAGHCGMAFERQVSGVHWVNAGAIGMPPNDGHAGTRFGVLSDGAVDFHRLAYDHAAAAAAMRDKGLTQGYDGALLSGFWPSEEILPPDLRRGRVQEDRARG